MSREGRSPPVLPDSVRETLEEFSSQFDLDLHVWSLGEDGSRTAQVYPALENGAPGGIREPSPASVLKLRFKGPHLPLAAGEGSTLILQGVFAGHDGMTLGSGTALIWLSACF